MFTAAASTEAKGGGNPSAQLTDEWINKRGLIHIVEYYPAILVEEQKQIHAAWMELYHTVEINLDTKGQISCDSTHMRHLERRIQKQKVDEKLPGLGKGGTGN